MTNFISSSQSSRHLLAGLCALALAFALACSGAKKEKAKPAAAEKAEAHHGEGEALALKVRETDAAYERLYPKTFPEAVSSDDLTRAAKSRWEETYAGFRRSALVQGQIADSAETDARLLDQILTRSNGSVGALQATQAGNELSALHVKQSLQLQTLLATQTRAETTDRARTLVAQQQAREQFKSFLGDGRAYTRGQ